MGPAPTDRAPPEREVDREVVQPHSGCRLDELSVMSTSEPSRKFKHLRPADYAPGGVSDRLVGFVDLAPTLLSLVGTESAEVGACIDAENQVVELLTGELPQYDNLPEAVVLAEDRRREFVALLLKVRGGLSNAKGEWRDNVVGRYRADLEQRRLDRGR
mgnify:CR=1 FL=1